MDSLELFGEILEPQNNWEHNWDEECDREVAAVTWKVETEPLVKKSLQKSKLKSLSKKISASAPALEFLASEPKEPPLLYSCSRCLFMCSDKNFLVAHSIIEHEESCAEFSQGDEQEVFVERSEAAKKIIAVVKHVILESITRTRCDTEIILEEANEAQLVSMNDIARSIVDSSLTVAPEACSDEQNNEAVFNSSIGSSCEREMEELLPNAAQNPKRRKKAQPRKLQIEKEDSSGDSGKGGEVVTLVETRQRETNEEVSNNNSSSFFDAFHGTIPTKPICPLCHQEFDSEMNLNTHLEDIHMSWISPEQTLYTDSSNSIPIVPFSSMTAGSTQHSQGAMEPWRTRHGRSCNRNHSKKRNWRDIKCNLCVKKPKMSLSEFKTHMTNTHHYRRAYCCHLCSTSFKSLEDFVEHNRIHEQRPFSCDVCDLSFKTKREQNEHRRSETHQKAVLELGQSDVDIVYEETSPIKCPSCDFRCHEMSVLAAHLREESHFHPCEYQGCNGFFRSKENLKNHIATVHEGHGAFLCDLCGKSFRLHATLMRHKGRNHNQKNLKKCSFCPATFADNYKLSRHIRSIHSKEKPFKCDFENCNKAFARKDKLQDHKWSHSKSKMFICHICDRAYLRPDCLKAHEKIHLTSFKHLTCHLCDSNFATKELYSRHLKTVHDVDINDTVKPKKTKSRKEKKTPAVMTSEKNILASDILVSAIASQLSIPEVFPSRLPNFEADSSSQFTLTVNNARLTDLQPVEVLVGGSGAVQSIHPVNLKFSKFDSTQSPNPPILHNSESAANNSNSCSPTILQPVENAEAPQFSHFSLADDWSHADPSIFLNSRPSMVSVDSKFIEPSRPNFLPSPKSE